MKRREFITLLGGAAAASLVARPTLTCAQPRDGVRRIGVLSGLAEGDPESRLRMHSRSKRGCAISAGSRDAICRSSTAGPAMARLLRQICAPNSWRLNPELILANSTPVATALHEQTRTVPIVFVQVTDPVGQGFVASLAQPGGNLTGITNFEFSIGSKWLRDPQGDCRRGSRGSRSSSTRKPRHSPICSIQPIKARRPHRSRMTRDAGLGARRLPSLSA